MEEQFNKEAKEGWRSAADAARITDETAGSEDRKYTSGGVSIAVDSNLSAVVGEEGAVASIPGNDGRITQAWVNVRGGVRVFSVYFWHSEGWTRRKRSSAGGSVEASQVTGHSWLVACDATMSPVVFEKSLLCQRIWMHVVAPEKASTCKSKGVKGEWIEKVTTTSLRQMEVVEDFESKLHKAVFFLVESKPWKNEELKT